MHIFNVKGIGIFQSEAFFLRHFFVVILLSWKYILIFWSFLQYNELFIQNDINFVNEITLLLPREVNSKTEIYIFFYTNCPIIGSQLY